MIKINSSILIVLYEIYTDVEFSSLFRSMLVWAMFGVIIQFLESLVVTSLTTEESININSYLFLYFVCSLLRQYINHKNDNHIVENFKPKITKKLNEKYWLFFENSNPKFIKESENIMDSSIQSGVHSLVSLCLNLLGLLQPVTMLLGQIFIVFRFCGIFNSMFVLSSLIIVFYIGIYTQTKNYENRKPIEVKKTELSELNKMCSKNLYIEKLNGNGMNFIEGIITANNNITELSIESSLESIRNWTFLNTSADTLEIILLYRLYTSQTREMVATFYALQKCFQYTYWIFNSTNGMFISASQWGKLEYLIEKKELFHSDKAYNVNTMQSISNIDLLNFVVDNFEEGKEIKINGNSGSGKTTWIYNKVNEVYNNFKPGQIIYLSQEATIDFNNRNIIDIMSDYCKSRSIPIDLAKLLFFSKELSIDNIINEDTINCKFSLPSPGERRRIIFLRAIIPILSNEIDHGIKVIFCDEITAGLDIEGNNESSFQKVRNIIKMLKYRYKISFVTIDHNHIDTKDIWKSYNVNKKIVNIEHLNKKQFEKFQTYSLLDSIINSMINIFQRNVDIYKKINKEESKTEVQVTLEENTYEIV